MAPSGTRLTFSMVLLSQLWMATQASVNCTCKEDAAQADMISALSWICGDSGINCAPINEGGSNYEPNTVEAHTSWAMNAYWQAHKNEGFLDTCYFNGIAKFQPTLTGHFYLIHGATADNTSALAFATTSKEGMGLTDTVPQHGEGALVYTSEPFSGKYNKGSTQFSLWVAANMPSKCDVYAQIEYDFDGNGKVDRTENYNKYVMGEVPQFQDYTQNVLTVSEVGKFKDMENGTITIKVVSGDESGCVNSLMAATNAFPSTVTGPFYNGL